MVLSLWKLIWEPPNRLGRRTRKKKSNRTKSYFSRNSLPRPIFWKSLGIFDFFILHTPRRYLRTAALKIFIFTLSLKHYSEDLFTIIFTSSIKFAWELFSIFPWSKQSSFLYKRNWRQFTDAKFLGGKQDVLRAMEKWWIC